MVFVSSDDEAEVGRKKEKGERIGAMAAQRGQQKLAEQS